MQHISFQNGEEALVNIAAPRIHGLLGSARQLHRGAHAPTFALAVLKETQAGKRGDEKERGGELRFPEARHRAHLIVILQEMHARAALLERERVEAPQGRQIAVHQCIQNALVVGVIEAQLDQSRLQPPIRFGNEHELGMLAAHFADCFLPEFAIRFVGGDSPGRAKHVAQKQHGDVAAHAVAALGESAKRGDVRIARGTTAQIDLHGVGPALEIRIAAMGEDAFDSVGPEVDEPIRGRLAKVADRSLDEPVGVLVEPQVVAPQVIADEVEDQPKAHLLQLGSKEIELCIPSDRGGCFVILNSVGGAFHIGDLPLRQKALVLA